MDIKRLAERLVDKHGTRDPFRIADALDYTIIYTPLVGVRGFYQYLKRCHIIYLDSELDEATARFVCAHELGHSFLHRGLNRIFMDTRTFIITGRYETEANQFAVDLIYSDEELQPYLSRSYERAAAYMGVSKALAEYRMGEGHAGTSGRRMGMKKALPGATNTEEGKEGSRLSDGLTALLSYQMQEEKTRWQPFKNRGEATKLPSPRAMIMPASGSVSI